MFLASLLFLSGLVSLEAFSLFPSSKPTWEWNHLLEEDVWVGQRLVNGQIPANKKIASFDFDNTIATTKGKSPFPKGGNDFKLWNDRLPDIFHELKGTHRIVIFTNQLGVKYRKISIEAVKQRIEGLIDLMDDNKLAVTVFAAVNKNHYRKPGSGMFELYRDSYTKGTGVDMDESFFCGDAAGRKKDFSSGDFHFALNSGLKFLTPEQFLTLAGDEKDLSNHRLSQVHEENVKSLPPLRDFDPKSHKNN